MALNKTVQANIQNIESLFIGGAWVPAVDGSLMTLVCPDTEEAFAEVAQGGLGDMDRAVAAARFAFDEGPWPTTPPKERAALVRKLGEALKVREAELAAVWTAQIGGLSHQAGLALQIGHGNFFNAASLAERFPFEEEVSSATAAYGLLVREPVGVVAAIAPWNGPYMLMTSKVAAALVAGCTVIMKPASDTPLEAYIIAECAEAVGIPAGVLNLVPSTRDAADQLVADPRVDKVSFTGSTEVGRRIASICGDRMARCTLELGGKSAAIVLDDFPIDIAAKMLAGTITLMGGQICSMLSRAIVSRDRHDELAAAIAAEMKLIKIGHSDDESAHMGPMASKRHYLRVLDYIEKGKSEATLVTGGGRPPNLDTGYFIEPTLFSDVDNQSSIAQEEIFGPVLVLIPADDVEDSVRIANESPFGLHGSVLSLDADQVYTIGKRIKTGSFAQNGMNVDFGLPFGGYKYSGIGREGGEEGLASYLETKVMLFNEKPTGLDFNT